MTVGPVPIAAAIRADDTSQHGVSFVVPVFNKERQLPPVLEALAAQDGDFEREYIFVDDGSTDGSARIIKEMTQDWENVHLIRQPNGGSANATNTGLAHARLPLVKFLDADDLLARDATQHLRDALVADPQAALAYGGRRFFRPGERPSLAPLPHAPAIERLDDPLTPAIRNSMFNPTQFMSRTDLCRKAGGCDERVVFSQEYSLTLRLARHGPFLRLDYSLAFLLDEEENRLSNDKPRQLQRVTRALRHFLEDYPDLPAQYRRLACRRAGGRAWRYARRTHRAGPASPWFGLHLKSLVGGGRDQAGFIAACEAVYDQTATSPGMPSE